MTIQVVHELPNIESRVVGLDIETTSTPSNSISNPWQDRIVSIAVSDGTDVWIIPPDGNFRSVIGLVNDPDKKKVIHNAVFDLSFIVHQLEADPVNISDSLLMSRLIHAGRGMKHGLDDCLAQLGIFMDKSTRTQFMAHRGDLTEEQIAYAANDVIHLPALREQQVKDICSAGLGKVAGLENKAMLTVVDMYLAGVGFDKELWASHMEWINRRLEEIKKSIMEITGCGYSTSFFGEVELDINLNSVKQLKDLLTKHGIAVKDTREATFAAYIERHAGTEQANLLGKVVEWKDWRKKASWDFESHVNPVSGRIHPSWNQLNAETGRFSCSGPNLQQIPRPKKDEPDFRKLFVASEGSSFVIQDWSQQEVRIFAQVCGDESLLEACRAGDVYTAVAKQVFNEDVEKGSERRFLVKTAVLACAYGARKTKLAAVLGKTEEEAEGLRQMILSTYPGMKVYADKQLNNLTRAGYVTTMWGRRRYFPEIVGIKPDNYWQFASQAVNTPVQGTAADIGKLAMVKLREYYKNVLEVKPILMIHDEFLVQVPDDKTEEVMYNVKEIMQLAAKEICPDVDIPAEGGVRKTWEKM